VAPDREILRPFLAAEEAVRLGRFSDVIRAVEPILRSSEDYFYLPDDDPDRIRSLRSEVEQFVSGLPLEGRKAFEVAYGAQAREKFERALAENDPAGLAEVAREFLHTPAGAQAVWLVGCEFLDRGQPLAAAHSLSRLQSTPAGQDYEPLLSLYLARAWRRSGLETHVSETLLALHSRSPDAAIESDGKRNRVFDAAGNAAPWLSEWLSSPASSPSRPPKNWTTVRGNAARNARSLGSNPLLNPRWRVSMSNDPDGQAELSGLPERLLRQGQVIVPSFQPLIVNGTVLTRTANSLLAVDLATGKRLWSVPASGPTSRPFDPFIPTPAPGRNRTAESNPQRLEQLFFDDLAYGTVSSDGKSVFSLCDLAPVTVFNVRQMRVVILPNGRRRSEQEAGERFNRLVAHDIRSGKLLWQLGGSSLDEEGPPLRLADTFFMGPPLAQDDRLYALVETSGEIRLIELDAATGDLTWSQQLVQLDRTIQDDVIRRLAGLTPTSAGGLLICPTALGVVVAVDPGTRSLVWAYSFSTPMDNVRNRMGIGFNVTVGAPARLSDRWLDSAVVAADGYLILTPVESGDLHCINVADGSMVWTQPRRDSLYVACVSDGRVVLMDQNQVRGLNLATGEPAWPAETVPLPDGASPSGRGFHDGRYYYLPMSTAEVAAVDLQTGHVAGRSKSRRGTVPGNLVSCQGSVVSQTPSSLDSFYPLEELEAEVSTRLAANPDDPDALARAGEILLVKGELDDAVDRLTRSHQQSPEVRTRLLLVDAHLERLRTDYDRYRQSVAEVEPLIDLPEQRVALLTLVARGRQQTDDVAGAFDAYEQLVALAPDDPPMDRIEPGRSIRRDRHIRGQLAILRGRADEATAKVMDDRIAARIPAPNQGDETGNLHRFLSYFRGQPAAQPAVDRLNLLLGAAVPGLDRELVYLCGLRSPLDSEQGRAAFDLAQMLAEAGRPSDAALFYRDLAGRWADQPVVGDTTGRQLLESLPADSAVRPFLVDSADWPVGKVLVEQKPQSTTIFRQGGFDFHGQQGPFFRGGRVEFDAQSMSIVGRDAAGRPLWKLPASELGSLRTNLNFTGVLNNVRAVGHLIVISLGNVVFAVDTLGATNGQAARLLWSRDLADGSAGGRAGVAVNMHMFRPNWGGMQVRQTDGAGDGLEVLGPVTESIVCFQKQRSLVAVEPLSGREIWVRHDIPPSSDVFGDEERVFIVPPEQGRAKVYSSLDGRELGERAVPPRSERMSTQGRFVLSWTGTDTSQFIVSWYDAWEEKTLWSEKFVGRSRGALLGQEAVGVLEPGGRFALIELTSGKKLIEATVDPMEGLSDVVMLKSGGLDLLVANRGPQNARNRGQAVPTSLLSSMMIYGKVHAFDRKTRERVWAAELDAKGLALDHPSDLPVLVFASIQSMTVPVPNQPNRSIIKTTSSLFCLDTRTGKVIVDESDLGRAIPGYDLVADPAHHVVEIKTLGGTYQLTFTGESSDAETPPAANDPSGEKKE
jgi:outer membrane protein assembly factor BamB/tetratricopeptide (TPR) repeat protein